MMEKFELQKLRDLPIEGVAERLGLQVTRHKCLCPFHDDHHASLSFKVSRNTFRCFVCGASGGPIDLVMKYLNKDFLDATSWLADGAALVITSYRHNEIMTKERPPFDASRYERFFEHPWLSPEARRFLFEERKLDPRVVRWCRLTSWKDKQGVPWLQIPYYDRDFKLIGIQNRNLSPYTPLSNRRGGGGEAPRFRFPQGSECGIYNLPVLNLLKPGDTLFITEGCSDCWAMLSAGHKAIAIPSATLLSRRDKEQLSTVRSTFGRSPLGPQGRLPEQEGENSPQQLSTVRSTFGRSPLGPQGRLPEQEGENSPLGSAAWHRQELSTNFGMFPDNDAPGERLFLQLKEVLPTLVRHQLPPGCKDFSDYYLMTRRKEGCP